MIRKFINLVPRQRVIMKGIVVCTMLYLHQPRLAYADSATRIKLQEEDL